MLTDHKALADFFRGKFADGILARWVLLLSRYNLTVKYLPGRINIIADSLSRILVGAEDHDELFEKEEQLIPDFMAPLTVADSPERVPPLEGKELLAGQLSDTVCLELRKKVEKRGFLEDDRRGKVYYLKDGILICKKSVKELGKPVLFHCPVIPDSLQMRVIALCHQDGHVSADKTMYILKCRYEFAKMPKRVKEYVRNCHECLVTSLRQPPLAPARRYPLPSKPFARVHIDLLGPLSLTEKGHRHILVLMDQLTRYCILTPLVSRSTTGITEALRIIFAKHGPPETIVSDNAHELTSQELNKLCKDYGVAKVEITAHHPSSNSLVERQMSKIAKLLRIYVDTLHTECWDLFLEEIAAALNDNLNESIGMSPFFALYNFHRTHLYNNTVTDKLPVYNYDEFFVQKQRLGRQVYEFISQQLNTAMDQYLARQRSKSKEREFKVSQRVYIRNRPKSGANQKLSKKWTGPCVILERVKLTTYRVKHQLTGIISDVHVDNILRAITEPEENGTEQKATPSIEDKKIPSKNINIPPKNKYKQRSKDSKDATSEPIIVRRSNRIKNKNNQNTE